MKFKGTDGNDNIGGSSDADVIKGLDGNDVLFGFGGNDRLYGGTGKDGLEGGKGADVLDGGEGDADSALFGHTDHGIFVDLKAGIVFDDGYGFQDTLRNIEDIGGSVFDDKIDGAAGRNRIFGNNGNDIIRGEGGKDKLNGGDGNDILIGGEGNDTLYGNNGNDQFRILPVDLTTNDPTASTRILDFSHDFDMIDLSRIDAIEGGADDPFVFIGSEAFHHVAGELRYEGDRNGSLVLGDTDGDGIADLVIDVRHVVSVGVTDFVL